MCHTLDFNFHCLPACCNWETASRQKAANRRVHKIMALSWTIRTRMLKLVNAQMHFGNFEASVVCTFIVTRQIWFQDFKALVHTASDRRCHYFHQTKLHVVSQICERERFMHCSILDYLCFCNCRRGWLRLLNLPTGVLWLFSTFVICDFLPFSYTLSMYPIIYLYISLQLFIAPFSLCYSIRINIDLIKVIEWNGDLGMFKGHSPHRMETTK